MATNKPANKPNPAPEQQSSETAAFVVTSPLTHDGVEYAIGDTVLLTAAQADPLLGHTVKEPTAS